MKKVFKFINILLLVCFLFCGCEKSDTAQTVVFKNVSGAGSSDFSLSVSFLDEKEYDEKYVDILVKSDKKCKVTIAKEFTNGEEVSFEEQNTWYSIKILLKQEKYETHKDILNVIYIIKSDEEVTLTFKGVVGDLVEDLLVNKLDVSKEFVAKVKKQVA